MSDPLDRLAKSYAKLERVIRWNLILLSIGIPALGIGNAALSLLRGGRWALTDAVRFGCMTVLGMLACASAAALYRGWKKQNAEIVDNYRQLTVAAEVLEGQKSFFDGIRDAHRQGLPVLIEPGELPDEPEHSLH